MNEADGDDFVNSRGQQVCGYCKCPDTSASSWGRQHWSWCMYASREPYREEG